MPFNKEAAKFPSLAAKSITFIDCLIIWNNLIFHLSYHIEFLKCVTTIRSNLAAVYDNNMKKKNILAVNWFFPIFMITKSYPTLIFLLFLWWFWNSFIHEGRHHLTLSDFVPAFIYKLIYCNKHEQIIF